MKLTYPILVSVAAAGLLFAPALEAQHGCPGCWGGRGFGPIGPGAQGQMHRGLPGMGGLGLGALLRFREQLELTDEQVSRLEALEEPLRQAHEEAQKTIQEHQRQLREAWQADEPDRNAIRSHMQAIMEAQQAAQLAALDAMLGARAVLTDEQRGRLQGWIGARAWGHRARMMRQPRRWRSRGMRRFRPRQF